MSWKDLFPKENRFFETENGILYNGDVLEILKQLPDESIDTVITSPPYWWLRFYGNEGNTIWGGDKNCNHEFDNEKVSVIFSTKSDKSTLCSGRGANPKQRSLDGEYITGYCKKCGAWYGQLGLEPNFQEYLEHLWIIFDEIYRILKPEGTLWVNLGDAYFSKTKGSGGRNSSMSKRKNAYKEKSLCLIPERFAIGMIERGWILRNQIIWYKPNAMPESVKDRFTVDFEKIFFFVKQKKYYFEQIKEPNKDKYEGRNGKGRNKRTVWSINTKAFKDAHFAVFPPDIPQTCIKAGCPNEGIVLDPFMGSGTTAVVAEQLGRRWVGIEINGKYCKIAKNRIENLIP